MEVVLQFILHYQLVFAATSSNLVWYSSIIKAQTIWLGKGNNLAGLGSVLCSGYTDFTMHTEVVGCCADSAQPRQPPVGWGDLA